MTAGNAAGSDVQMSLAAEIAYLDANMGSVNNGSSAKESVNVMNLVDDIINNYQGRDNLSESQKSQLNTAMDIKEMVEKNNLQNEVSSWKIVNSQDNNTDSGFYGCLIETGDNEAIVAFRGSENYDAQVLHDWGEADFNLLDNPMTRQQKEAQDFTRMMYEQYGDKYSYSFSGHSLGGNLAQHAYITAPSGMNVNRCTSWDGPGFSDEYIAAHLPQIMQRGSGIDHYQWSLVGAVLHPLPGAHFQTIQAENAAPGDGLLDNWFGLKPLILRHLMAHVQFDENGQVIPGTMDPLAMVAGYITKILEHNPVLAFYVGVGRTVAMVIQLIAEGDAYLIEYFKNLGIDFFEKTVELINNALQNLKYFVNGVRFTGEYDIEISIVNSLGNEMNEVSRNVQRISDEVSDISNQLRYNSMSGSYYKSRLRSSSSRLVQSVQKAVSLSEAAHTCADYAKNSDAQAAAYYQFG